MFIDKKNDTEISEIDYVTYVIEDVENIDNINFDDEENSALEDDISINEF